MWECIDFTGVSILRIPSKVLIAGGYGVLEPHNFGVSLAINNYFYVLFTHKLHSHQNSVIKVSSPQLGSEWNYEYIVKCGELCRSSKNTQNQFVDNALKYSLRYCDVRSKSISIVLLFDKGFISEICEQASTSCDFPNYKTIKKTGLGSSACTVVSIVSAICFICGCKSLQIINAISQIANLAAQNKVGSNFDISTAVYGSQLYKNILPALAFDCSVSLQTNHAVFSVDQQIEALGFKQNLQVYLLDLECGSNTRVMVTSFLKQLNRLDECLIKAFYSRSKQICMEVFKAYECSNYDKLKQLNRVHRSFLQQYTKLTDVNVEPPQLTPLLDSIAALEEVIYVICPGSGGYDSICVLTTQQFGQKARAVIQQFDVKVRRFGLSYGGIQQKNETTQKQFPLLEFQRYLYPEWNHYF